MTYRFLTTGRYRALVLLLACCWFAPTVSATEPVIRNINIRGIQIGGSTNLVIDGDNLAAGRLLLPFPIKQELKAGSNDKKATYDVQLDGNVEPGYYQLRLATEAGGVSLPTLICVDRLPQKVLVAAAAEQLPIALHGVAGGGVIEVKFAGKAKQRVIAEVEAQRIGAKLRPVLHIMSPKKLQLAWSWGTPSLFGDARIETVLPEDGEYTVTLHDVEYASPAPGFFRLRIGEWSYADMTFPPAVARNSAAAVELVGMPAPVRVDVPAAPKGFWLRVPWPKDGLWSGLRPFVTVSSHPEILKRTPPGKVQDLPVGPLGVSGRLLAPFDEDRFLVPVTPLKKIRLEVFAERIGSPLDAALVVRNEKGDALVRVEDSPGTLDPVLEYAVPDKVTSITVGVVDSQGRAGARSIYRLVVTPLGGTNGPKDSFRLSTTVQHLGLPVGGRVTFPVFLDRQGYVGKIDLAADLPKGLKIEGTLIPDGADGTLVTVERGDAPFDPAITSWVGKGGDGTEQPVHVKGHPLERLQPWLAAEFALAPTSAKTKDFTVAWRDLPKDAALYPAGKLVLPLKVARADPKTVVKLSLLTSQVVDAKPDPNKTFRQEKVAELAANVDNGEVTILVPAELPAPTYDVTVQAELLTADKKTVLATTFLPVQRLPVRPSLTVLLKGSNRIDGTIDAKKGGSVKIEGKIERREPLKEDVAVNVTGLPAGAKVGPVTVKAGQTDFVIEVVFPPNTPAGEIKGVILSASAAPDGKVPTVRVKSKDVDVTLVVKVVN